MTGKTVPRYKTNDEMSADELWQFAKTGERPESAAYRKARADALRAAGFEVDEAPEDRDLESLTPAELYERSRR